MLAGSCMYEYMDYGKIKSFYDSIRCYSYGNKGNWYKTVGKRLLKV